MASPRKRKMRNNLRIARVLQKRAARMGTATEEVAAAPVVEEVVEETPKPTRRRKKSTLNKVSTKAVKSEE